MADEVDATAAAVVAAVQAYSKINAAGQWVDRSETVNDLFERMSTFELEPSAKEGNFTSWLLANMLIRFLFATALFFEGGAKESLQSSALDLDVPALRTLASRGRLTSH